MTDDSIAQSAPSPEEKPPTKRGKRWTLEEETRLVAEVREGKDLQAIADEHERSRGAVVARLVMMLPEEKHVLDEERVGTIIEKLTSDPDYDWQSHLDLLRRPREAPAQPVSDADRLVGKRLTTPTQILALWQEATGQQLSERHRADFLESPPVSDLGFFSTGRLRESGQAVYRSRRELRLNTWAAECAVPGTVARVPADNLSAVFDQVITAVRACLDIAVAAVPDDDDRHVLSRRLGLHGGDPETLQQIGDAFGVTRERIRQRQDRALQKMTAFYARPGYRTARDHAAAQLASLFIREDGTVDLDRLTAAADLVFPRTQNGIAQRVLSHLVKRAA